MQALERNLRTKLERTIREALDTAEAAAKASLGWLGVAEAKVPQHLTEEQRELRRKLRIHGRQLGDKLNAQTDVQNVDHLVEEIAYEHWHRMLFARFLAENNLLMFPDAKNPVPVSLEECEDLAPEENAKNGWELAARFAGAMLPKVFRTSSPVFKLSLPPERQVVLEKLIADLPREVFVASDSLGWVYQYWQAKRKEDVNNSEVKIGANELPAVTQLFTEPYMVAFLLDNSLGAWWARKRLTNSDLTTAQTEEELRKKAALPNLPLNYLRFVRNEQGAWEPAAGWFEKWPASLKDFSLLDPCCGSGHFLVAALLMLVPIRMELEHLSEKVAIELVLKENLHGLELDPRCVEIAAFAVALTAWSYPNSGGYRPLPDLSIACSGLSVSASKEEWASLAGFNVTLRFALERMFDQFSQAPTLGSLLDPSKALATGTLAEVSWEKMGTLLEKALASEKKDEQIEMGIVAQGLAKAATILSGKYNWVVTNVPYLARGKQSDSLRDYCEEHYGAAKNDLATVFLERCLELCCDNGTSCVVLPQNWLFLTTYKKFRENLLKNETWHLIALLGPGAFETISGEVVKAILISISRDAKAKKQGAFDKPTAHGFIRGVDVSEPRTASEKAEMLIGGEVKSVSQDDQLKNPDASVTLEKISSLCFVSSYAQPYKGLGTGDDPRYRKRFWEVNFSNSSWIVFRSAPSKFSTWGEGNEDVLKWDDGCGDLAKSPTSYLRNTDQWSQHGILFSMMGDLPATLYSGSAWDTACCTLIPKSADLLLPLWCFVESGDLNKTLRLLNQKLSVEVNHFGQASIDLAHWWRISEVRYPHGLPKPHSDNPNQWIFHGHPCGSVVWDENTKKLAHGELRKAETVLQVAVARLLGYQWPAELDPKMELSEESRQWFTKAQALNRHADNDGIVCIPAIGNEQAASDRLLNLLVEAYGTAWTNSTLGELLTAADNAGKTLEVWLRDKFFAQHCKLFQNRPFVWHVWDGLRDGFSVLLNYHKLNKKNLETLTYTYLGEWIKRQKADVAKGVDGSEEKLAAAEVLKKSLELILKGEKPHDIFVRWKPIEKMPIGWEPDINDGVRLNIRPFLMAPDIGKAGAGILRDKPNVKWDKDRGKDVESAPWFNVFKGERINDHHLSLEEKTKARERERGQ